MSKRQKATEQPTLPWTELEAVWTIKDIGAPLLASLAEGLYDAHEVLREYVQNAIDSYVDFSSLTGRDPQNSVQVFVDEDAAQVRIYDRGVGMDERDILQAKSIAVSHKLERQGEFVGFRGIGIWSGLSVCDSLVIETTKVGDPWLFRLAMDFKAVREHVYEPIPVDELLQGKFSIRRQAHDADDHFTDVTLVNVDRHRYAPLLNVVALERFAQQYLPVPFDPEWPQSGQLSQALKSVPWTTNFELTINGLPVHRHFPASQIKAAQFETISDEEGLPVAHAWVAETNRRGTKKAIDVNHQAGEVNNFAVRVKNFSVGPRGLYSSHQDVLDKDNLSWYVGEIYITDPEIKPDTNRRTFQRSFRSDAVEKALRKFYSRVATGARGWSEEVSATNLAEAVQGYYDAAIKAISDGSDNLKTSIGQANNAKGTLEDYKSQAAKIDRPDDSDRVLAVRRHLRKPEVKTAIDKALGQIADLESRISNLPDNQKLGSSDDIKPKKDSRARTARNAGTRISTSDAVGTQASTGGQAAATTDGTVRQTIELDAAIEIFLDTVAAVAGTSSETYRLIDQRLSEELKRRGFEV